MGNKLKQIKVNFVNGDSIDITNEVQRLLDGVNSDVEDYAEELKAVLHSNYKYFTPEAIDAIVGDYLQTEQQVTEAAEPPINDLASKFNLNKRDIKCKNCKYFGYNNGLTIDTYGKARCKNKQHGAGTTYSTNYCKHFEPLEDKQVDEDYDPDRARHIGAAINQRHYLTKNDISYGKKRGISYEDSGRRQDKDFRKVTIGDTTYDNSDLVRAGANWGEPFDLVDYHEKHQVRDSDAWRYGHKPGYGRAQWYIDHDPKVAKAGDAEYNRASQEKMVELKKLLKTRKAAQTNIDKGNDTTGRYLKQRSNAQDKIDAMLGRQPYIDDDGFEQDDISEAFVISEAANSNGVYSLYNGWVKRPEAENIPDDIDLGDQLDMWEYKCDQVNTVEEIDELLDDIYKMRYESLVNGGEYSVGNLVFKELRNHGKLKELKDKKIEIENDDMSLN